MQEIIAIEPAYRGGKAVADLYKAITGKNWSPLDYPRLLWWLLVTPPRLKAYQKQWGKEALKTGVSRLAYTLIFLPLFLPALGLGLGLLPRTDAAKSQQMYFWLAVGVGLLWHLLCELTPNALEDAGVWHHGEFFFVALGVFFFVALGVASFVVLGVASVVTYAMPSGIAYGVAFVVALSMAYGVAFAVSDVVSDGMADVVTFGVLDVVSVGVSPAKMTRGVAFVVASSMAAGVVHTVSEVVLDVVSDGMATVVIPGVALVMAFVVILGVPLRVTRVIKKNTDNTRSIRWALVLFVLSLGALAFLSLGGLTWLQSGSWPAPVWPFDAEEQQTSQPAVPDTLTPTPTFTPTPTLTPISPPETETTWTRPQDGMTMAYIPAGCFQMGREYGDRDERPVHEVCLDAFWMDTHEVTNAMYAQFLNERGNQGTGSATWLDTDAANVRIHQQDGEWAADAGYADHPVVEVSWYGARAYCEWTGDRLPTEAEWEYAARGGLEGKDYPWGDESATCTPGAENGAQFSACSGKTVPVMTFAPNDYGLYDMAGNVWEWVADWYDRDYYQNSPQQNPTGPKRGEYRVLRGGSWDFGGDCLNVALRNWLYPGVTRDSDGFRCLRSATSP